MEVDLTKQELIEILSWVEQLRHYIPAVFQTEDSQSVIAKLRSALTTIDSKANDSPAPQT